MTVILMHNNCILETWEQQPHETPCHLMQRFIANYFPEDGDEIRIEGFDMQYDD